MRLTSKEQALLTVALDSYLQNADSGYSHESDQMWADLYDDVIDADIDDDGTDEEYDPSELDWDAHLIACWAGDLADGEDAKECAEAVVECLTDDTAWALYHALNTRFDAEFERQAEEMQSEWLREQSAQLDIEDAINGVNAFHGVNVDVATQPDAAA